MSVYVQTNQPVILGDAAYTVSATDTGKLFLFRTQLNAARTITLPAEPGLHFRFMVSLNNGAGGANILGAAVNNDAIITSPVNGKVQGTLLCSNGPAAVMVLKNDANTARFDNTSVTGDYMDVYCDGEFWNISGMSRVTGGFV